jgi:tetratricopeptide (TPR) repeat protein
MARAEAHFVLRRARFWFIGLVAALAYPAWVAANPYLPRDDSEVVETLPASSAERGLKLMRAALLRDPGNLELALRVARRYIDTSRNEGDPRFLGYAQSALAAWWNGDIPDVVLLRATIRQSRHEFEPALDDLRRLTRARPELAQAWLTRATVEQVRGRFDEARESCQRLAELNRSVVGIACVADVDSLTGDRQAYDRLSRRLESDSNLDAATRGWLYTMLAEMAERRGAPADAERYFNAAMAIAPSLYLRAAFADFLLAAGRPREVVELIATKPAQISQLPDSLLLRRVLALRMLGEKTELKSLSAEMRARFAAASERGENLHAREEARFVLAVDGNAARAVELAQLNWRNQKEAADARILALAAREAGKPDVLDSLRDFVRETRFTDAALAALL